MKLSDQDIQRLAQLQSETLPGSLLTRLGPRYCRGLWRTTQHANKLCADIIRDQAGQIIGAALTTMDARTFTRDLALHTPMIWHVWRVLPSLTSRQDHTDIPGPEMVLISVAPDMQGKGIGKQLLQKVCDRVKTQGATDLFVRTEAYPSHALALFYEGFGFERLKTFSSRGSDFALYKLDLASRLGAT